MPQLHAAGLQVCQMVGFGDADLPVPSGPDLNAPSFLQEGDDIEQKLQEVRE